MKKGMIFMDDGQSKKFSRREWLLVICILLLLEYGVTTLSYNFSNEQNVLNYISFAGTIASILLAVIAIIYGFYQNDSQQKVSGALTEQVNNLNSASIQLAAARTKLETQLDRIDAVASKLDEVGSGVKDIQGGISALHQSQRDMANSMLKKLPVNQPPAGQHDLNNAATLILRNTTLQADVFIRTLLHFSRLQAEKNYNPTWQEMVVKYYASPASKIREKKDQAIEATTLGVMATQIIGTLRAFQLMKSEEIDGERRFKLSQTLLDILPTLDEEVRNTKTSDFTVKGQELIDEAFKANPI